MQAGQLLLSLAALGSLVACNGGDAPAGAGTRVGAMAAAPEVPNMRIQAVNPSAWVTVPVVADALLQGLNIPADAAQRGMWSAPRPWPFIGLHSTLLPTGKVLTWGTNPDGSQQNGRYFDLWDPALGLAAGHQTSYDPARQDSFCAAATFLTDGRLMITGGNGGGGQSSSLYSPAANSLSQGANAADQRWYATMITLADGRPIILGGMVPYTEGMYTNPDLSVSQGLASMTPEVFENGGWRSLFNASSRDAFGPDFLRTSYPRAWVAPNGRVVGVSAEKLWSLDPSGNGQISTLGNFKTGFDNNSRPNVGATNSAVMYAPGQVLVVGGNAPHNGFGSPASRLATAIDFNGNGVVLTEQPAMAFARHFPNTIVLPTGEVLVTGGETVARNDPATGVFAAELWNPATGTWRTGASASIFRGYHSITNLLPNGTVLSTGGGNPGPAQLWGEVYYPPYLFRSVGGSAQLAPRPVMAAVSGLSYANGAELQVDMANADAVAQLVLVGASSGTHSFNSGQRRVPLSFTQDGIRLSATLPGNTVAPPGYYQLIAIDGSGVPSRGTLIAVGQNVSAPPVPTQPYTPPELGVASISAPLISAGGTASFSVPAVAGNTYSWRFGDGSADSPFSADPAVGHVYAQPGVYGVTLTVRSANGSTVQRNLVQGVAAAATARAPTQSQAMALEPRGSAAARLWVANPDTDTVAVIDTATRSRLAEVVVGSAPRSVARAPDGRIWVVNKGSASLSVINANTLAVVQTIALPRASQPHGLAFAPDGSSAWLVLQATGQLLRLNPATGATLGALGLGPDVQQLAITADSAQVLVSRFISPPVPSEGTASVATAQGTGQLLVVDAATLALKRTVALRHSDKVDNEIQGAGLPNYLGAAAVSPDGRSAWVPSKQDNIGRGQLRNGLGLNFQNTVRAISSRIDLATLAEDQPRRIDHDNAGLATAAAYHPSGVYLMVALETSRQVAVVGADGGQELFRLDVGRAPQALQMSADGQRLYVQNFMDRSVSVFDLGPLVANGELRANLLGTVPSVGTEKLSAQVLLGKQLFYDARDTRLARDGYLSCATCHADAGHDGRVWDLTGFGEGLRNTPALKGRGGMGQGFVHWSANFDEVQDFEGQIRTLAGGTGLMADAQFNAGTRSQPLGERKAGLSADLDALAAYLGSLNRFDPSPLREADGSLSAAALAGQGVFRAMACASCHDGAGFTASSNGSGLKDIGTLKPGSGKRLGAALNGIDVPTLRDLWATAPYLHDGSAATLADAVLAHADTPLAPTDLANLVAYLQQIGTEEPGPNTGSLPAGALGAWDFDTASGNNATGGSAPDTTGNGRPLSWASGTTLTGSGVLGAALQGGGANGPAAATTAGPVVDTASSFSISGWIRFDQLPDCWNQALASQDGNTVSGFSLGITPPCNGNPARFQFAMLGGDADASPEFAARSANAPVIGSWVHLVGVRDVAAGTVALYVNGQLVQTTATALRWSANGSFAVGRAKFSGQLRDPAYAAIDAVRAYGRALSASDVAALYQARGGSGNSNPGTPAPNLLPTVALTAPAPATSVAAGSTLALTANAADRDGSVARVEFFDGNSLIGSDSSAPYAINWSASAPGPHSLTARATDSSGGVTVSSAVAITVTAPPPNQPPTVALASPTANASFVQGSAIVLLANAADSDGSVAQVRFYDGTSLIGSSSAAPYSLSWSGAAVGSHTLTAVVQDNNGASTTSAAVTVRVNAPPPPPPPPAPTVPAGAVGEWRFDSVAGNLVADASGQGKALTLGNGTSISAGGRAGAGLQVAGYSSAGAASAGALLDTSASFSVSGWIRLASLPNCADQMLASQDGADVSGFGLGIAPPCNGQPARFRFVMLGADNSASPLYDIQSAASPVPAQWYHLVAVRDVAANSMALYLDGVLVQRLANPSRWAATGPFVLGRARFVGGPMGGANGSIDEVRAYARALDATEVDQLYRASGTVPVAQANRPPTVALSAPGSNTAVAVGDSLTLSASAADSDGSVASVTFYDGNTAIGTRSSAPYTLSWTASTPGTHLISAQATDNSGGVATSASSNVVVSAAVATPSLPTGALADWRFDQASAGVVADASGQGKALTLGGGTTLTASGLSGAGLQVAGSNSSGATTAAALVDTAGSFSVSGWLRLSSLPNCSDQLLASQDGAQVSGFALGITPPCNGSAARFRFIMFGADTPATRFYDIQSSSSPVAGTWYHLVAVRDAGAGTMSLYLDGVLVNTLPNADKWAATGPFVLGRARFGGWALGGVSGTVDAVRVYGRAITAPEVAQLQAAR